MFQRAFLPLRVLSGTLLFFWLALPLFAQTAGPESGTNTQAQPAHTKGTLDQVLPGNPKFHGVPWRDAHAPIAPAAPAGAHLSYFGGPVISNVHVVQVLYGSGSYNAQVAGSSTPSIGNFYGEQFRFLEQNEQRCFSVRSVV